MKYIIEICVGIDIAIMGIAYPIIIDKITSIGEKYSSIYLSKIFDTEYPNKVIISRGVLKLTRFQLLLFITLLSFLFLIVPLNPLVFKNAWLVNNSAYLLVFILTCALVILFFFWLNRVTLYTGKSITLINHLIIKFKSKKTPSIDKSYLFKTINELAINSLINGDDHVQKIFLDFYYEQFAKDRKNLKEGKGLIYNIELYDLVSKVSNVAASTKKIELQALLHRCVSGIWLMGDDFSEIEISNDTYRRIWYNLTLLAKSSDHLRTYWSTVNQYYTMRLSPIFHNYSDGKIINEDDIKKREKERSKFLEFNLALGGLLIYYQNIETLKYILSYSQSSPPKYVLLPNTMTEVFEWYDLFSSEFRDGEMPIDLEYSFPGIDNYGIAKDVNYWMSFYIAILFVRQYTLDKYYVYQNFTDQPSIPNKKNELINWLRKLPFFQNLVTEVLADELLLNNLGYKKVVENEKERIDDFFIEFEKKLKDEIKKVDLEKEISKIKVKQFEGSTMKIINDSLDSYSMLFSREFENIDKFKQIITIKGDRDLLPRYSFTDGDDEIMNFDKILAQVISTRKFQYIFPTVYYSNWTSKYLLNDNNLIEGLKRLNLQEDHLLILINGSFDIISIVKPSYNNIIAINSSNRSISDAFLIINKKDLPKIEYLDLSIEEQSENKLKIIDEDIKLYTSVVDLFSKENEKLIEKFIPENNRDSDPRVLVNIAFRYKLYWKNKTNLVLVEVDSQYKEKGVQNDIDDIVPL